MIDHRIETFLTLCDTLSYTKTASILNITQPAVTQHIKHLEKLYNDKFFTYEDKVLKLTSFGDKYRVFCISMRANESKFEQDILKDKDKVYNLNFGATKTIGEFVIEDALLNFFNIHPKNDIHLQIENTQCLLHMLEKGEIDFALIEGSFDKSKFDYQLHRNEQFICVCSPNLDVPECVNDISQLFNFRLIVREKGSGTRHVLEQSLSKNSYTIDLFKNITEISSFNVIKALLHNNIGITFCYKSVVSNELNNGTLKEIKINQFNEYREFNYVYLLNSINKDSIETFISCFQ